jgi:hypothetical protein
MHCNFTDLFAPAPGEEIVNRVRSVRLRTPLCGAEQERAGDREERAGIPEGQPGTLEELKFIRSRLRFFIEFLVAVIPFSKYLFPFVRSLSNGARASPIRPLSHVCCHATWLCKDDVGPPLLLTRNRKVRTLKSELTVSLLLQYDLVAFLEALDDLGLRAV